jgi:hypothetical protein
MQIQLKVDDINIGAIYPNLWRFSPWLYPVLTLTAPLSLNLTSCSQKNSSSELTYLSKANSPPSLRSSVVVLWFEAVACPNPQPTCRAFPATAQVRWEEAQGTLHAAAAIGIRNQAFWAQVTLLQGWDAWSWKEKDVSLATVRSTHLRLSLSWKEALNRLRRHILSLMTGLINSPESLSSNLVFTAWQHSHLGPENSNNTFGDTQKTCRRGPKFRKNMQGISCWVSQSFFAWDAKVTYVQTCPIGIFPSLVLIHSSHKWLKTRLAGKLYIQGWKYCSSCFVRWDYWNPLSISKISPIGTASSDVHPPIRMEKS